VSPYDWSWNPEALVLVPVTTAGYLLVTTRIPAPAWRKACFLAAMALLLAITITPFETIALRYLLVVHLLQNVVLAEWAPLLIVLGIPAVLAARLGRLPVWRTIVHPLVALPLWVGNYILWHVPAVYDAALRSPHGLLHFEHLAYLLTGIAMWWCVWQDHPRSLVPGLRAAYVFAGFVASAPLGLVLALVPEPVYVFYVNAPERLWGIDPLVDQQLGGILMGVEQAVVFFAVFAYWFARFFAEQDHADGDVATAVDATNPGA
jgi:cytochrome c oxidase assembly factor CtaG